MSKQLAIYESETHPGQKLEVKWDGCQLTCSCLHYTAHGACKHILDYDLSGGVNAEKIVDSSHSSNPQIQNTTTVENDGIDAPDFEKPSSRELAPDIEEAVKEAARKMKGE